MNIDKFKIAIPAKTFLLGEYAALYGGPSIIFCTTPSFEFSWTSVKSASGRAMLAHPFHADSAAGQYLTKFASASVPASALANREVRVAFADPYRGIGGLGASSAEFLGAWVLVRWLIDSVERRPEWMPNVKVHLSQICTEAEVLTEFKSVVPNASGADVLAQRTGLIHISDLKERNSVQCDWRIEGLEFSILHTGKKLPTHSHLATASGIENSVVLALRESAVIGIDAFDRKDSTGLAGAVRAARKTLHEAGLTAEHTVAILKGIDEIPKVYAAKGCGAMGSDVVLVLHAPEARRALLDYAAKASLKMIAQSSDFPLAGLTKLERVPA